MADDKTQQELAGKQEQSPESLTENGQSKRDFVVLGASAIACVGAVAAAVPFIDSLNPAKDVLAVGSIEVDLKKIAEGTTLTAMYRGGPVFIRHRTAKEIEEAQAVNLKDLKDPQEDSARVKKGEEQWLIVIGICTHLGCVPLDHKGDYGGWFCPCHGSHYDTSGRIRKGPAPSNLVVPPYKFITNDLVKIGEA